MRSNMLNNVFKVTAIAAALLSAGQASAADVYLQAQSFDKDIPNNDGMGGTIPVRMWGFATCNSDFSVCGAPNAPGPQLEFDVGEGSLTIHVDNTLDIPVSVIIPGLGGDGDPLMISDGLGRSRVRSLTHETDPGDSNTYTWTLRQGTFLYQSGTAPSLEVPMGLYGALVVTNGTEAYPADDSHAAVVPDSEALLLFSEIDPIQNGRVDSASASGLPTQECLSLAQYTDSTSPGYLDNSMYPCTIDYYPVITLVNGAPTVDLSAGITPGDDVLLRMLNAGQHTHVASIVNVEMDLITEDANRYPGLARTQAEALLPAGKTTDAVIHTDDGTDITLPVFDRMPTYNNETVPNGGAIAGIVVGAGSTTTAPTTYATNDEYAVTEDTAFNSGAASVLDNDTGLAGAAVAVATDVSNGSLTLNGNGTFAYTPDTDFSGTDSFTYRATLAGIDYLAQVNLNVSFENDAPTANADGPYSNSVGTTITVDAQHGVLGNDVDPDGDTLTAMLDAPVPGLTLNADGSFEYTGGSSTTFSYHAEDATQSSNSIVVSLNYGEPSGIALNVISPEGAAVTSYRWIVQEDATYHVDPAAPADPADQLSTNFHKSYMPVVAQGCAGAGCANDNPIIPVAAFTQAVLDPARHYYVSVLPTNAGSGAGHTLGGAQIPAGTATGTVINVITNNQPVPTAQISVIIFEDGAPTNGVPDPGEAGLGGFQINIEDAAGRYGQSPGFVQQDVDGNPLVNALASDPNCYGDGPPPTPGVVVTCDDGTALIKNLPPGKFGIIAVAPAGPETWTQTSTIEGTPVQDTWVKANEPPFLVEFGAPGYHAFIGFVNPAHTIVPPEVPSGQRNNSITGNVTMIHTARAPDVTAFDSGNYNALSHTRPWVGLNSINGDGPNIATVQADLVESGDDLLAQFQIDGIPDGTYQLVIWDDYLDQIISYQTVILSGGTTDVGNIAVPTWFGRHEHNVFLDNNQNGTRDDGEVGLQEQNVNLRFRDGTIFQAFPTDTTGFVPFDQVFPFGAWQVAEIDFGRYKATGVTVTVDGGGDLTGSPYPGLLNPQDGSPRTDTDPAPVLLEGFQSMPGMTSLFDWGKAPYAPGENGGIAGIVFYGSTRGENDPRLTVGDTWEPGIPHVTVRLHKEIPTADGGTTLKLVDEVQTDSWDDNPPTGCPGEDPAGPFVTDTLHGDATRCFDGIRNFEQVRPGALFDGGYAFGDLEPGAYVVEVVLPAGYEVIKEEDKNVDFGDAFAMAPAPMMVAAAMVVLPDAAMVAEARNLQWGLAAPECVGPDHVVPDTLSLFPGEVNTYAPFAGATRPLCTLKRVILADQQNAAADFHLFTSTPVAGQFAGLSTDDIAVDPDPASANFGDKWGPPYMPYTQRDYMGNIVYHSYTDAFGRYNGLVPSTFSANVPIPSGYSPGMYSVCLNDPFLPDGITPDPFHLPQYGNFCYTLMYMPGTTTYPDTPLLPQSAFAAGFNPVDCALPDGYPVVAQVDGTGVGPLVAPGGTLTIYSQGPTTVPNPEYEGPLSANNQPFITRNYSFGSPGTVRLGNTTIPAGNVTWTDSTITVNLTGSGVTAGSYELVLTNAAGQSSINTVTVTVGGSATHVTAADGPTAIQDAIDAANPGDLIIVEPGTYNELVVMHKPVRLQGSGASTIINAVKLPPEKLKTWQDKVVALLDAGAFDLLPGQPSQVDLVGPGLFSTEQGGGITVLSKDDGSWALGASRIDGFTITGADGGGGIYVNGYADNLVISNNNVTGNSGVMHGGIRIGQPYLPQNGNGPFGYNENVRIHHNSITLNGGQADNSAGGGVALCTGTDDYMVDHNYICGNFNLGDGAGISHLGLSDNGTIQFNSILFNQNFNQGLGANGAGVLIAGEPPNGTTLTLGAGDVVLDGNLIQGNQSGSGLGAGVRTQLVNGEDVAASGNSNNWWSVRMTNNMIVNNVTGWAGGGISMQDTVRATIVLNTIANNDSTGTAGSILGLGEQPAGISSELNSLGLSAVITNNSSGNQAFSNPTLTHNIIWHNRAFTYSDVVSPHLEPVLGPSAPGACADGAHFYDLGVIDSTGPNISLNPQRNILTSGAGNNISEDPEFVNEYCNTARDLTAAPMQVAAEPEEGGNWIDVRYGPLTQELPGNPDGPWNYHLSNVGSPAVNAFSNNPTGANVNHDFDNEDRPTGNGRSNRVDVGADEYSGSSANPGLPGTLGFAGASLGVLNGNVLNFGNQPNGNVVSTLTLTAVGNTVQVGAMRAFGPRFNLAANTCAGQTLNVGQTCTVDVVFNATGRFPRLGLLAVAQQGAQDPALLLLTGR